MKDQPSGVGLRQYLARRLLPSALAIGILLSVSLPLTYYLLEAARLKQTATIYAKEIAEGMVVIIGESPILWKYQVQKYLKMIYDYTSNKDIAHIHVFDERGQLISEYDVTHHHTAAEHARGETSGRAAVVFNNRPAGTVYVFMSLAAVIRKTFLIFLVSLVSGSGLAFFTYAFPLRVVRDADETIRKAHEELGRKVEERTRDLAAINEALKLENAERKKTEEALERSEAMFKGVFDNAWDGILIADVEAMKFLAGNRAICRTLGYDEEEIKQLGIADIHPEKDMPDILAQYEKQARNKTAFLRGLPVKRRDGSVYYADIGSAAFILQGKLCQIGILRDITERRQVEEEIRRLNVTLNLKVKELIEAQEELVRKEKLSILGQLSGSVGHELRSPLGIISNAVYYLKTVLPEADEMVKEYLGIIKSEVDNSERIITDLLDFSRAKRPQLKRIAIDELIRRCCASCTIRENVTLQLDMPDTSPLVLVDPLHLEQVFRNLITNGIQAMPGGGVLAIRAKENPEDGTVRISITDTGEGIAPENMNKLFQPLFTTKARGIGLGLIVSRNLVEANGGRIEVESHVGQGTTFTVILPLGRG